MTTTTDRPYLDNGTKWDEAGHTWRVTMPADEIVSIMDFDDLCYGRFAWVERGEHRGRPQGFTGNAEILRTRDNDMWWEPSTGGPKRGTQEFSHERRNIIDLLEYGFIGVVVEMVEECGECHREHIRHDASLWGIEPFIEQDYLNSVVTYLMGEVLAEIGVEQGS